MTPGAAAAGPTVPLAAACDSLRWARKALAAARDGCIGCGRLGDPIEQFALGLISHSTLVSGSRGHEIGAE